MKRIKTLRAAAILCLVHCALCINVSCTQEEIDDSNTLPEGKYPLLIDSATVVDDAQTRISESSATQSAWASGDIIGAKVGNSKEGTYKYNGTKFVAVNAAYWQNMEPATVYAWYPTDGTIDLSDQSSGLKYVLKAEKTNVDFNTQPKMAFTHQLAKVRVMLPGYGSGAVTVKVYSYKSCQQNEGTVASGNTPEWITMKECTYSGSRCWEANVVHNYEIKSVKIQENGGSEKEIQLNTTVKPEAGKCHEITINVTKNVSLPSVTGNTYTVTAGENVVIDGNSTSLDKQIYINDGATVTLKNVILSVKNRNAIYCNGDVTLILEGTNKTTANNNKTINTYSAIIVKSGKTLTIKGEGSITASITGNAAAAISAAIGSAQAQNCGNIVIESGTINANGGSNSADIGSGQGSSCGNITINGGNVTCNHLIGTGLLNNSTCGNISINGGTVKTKYIGKLDYFQGSCGTITISDNAKVTGTVNK